MARPCELHWEKETSRQPKTRARLRQQIRQNQLEDEPFRTLTSGGKRQQPPLNQIDWIHDEESRDNAPNLSVSGIRLRQQTLQPQTDELGCNGIRNKNPSSHILDVVPKAPQPAWKTSIGCYKLGIAVVLCSLLFFAYDSTRRGIFNPFRILFVKAQEVLNQAKQIMTEVTRVLNSLKAGDEKFDRREEEEDLDENGFERKKVYETGVKRGEDGKSFEIYKSSSSRVKVHRETSPLMAEIEARKKKYRPDYKP